MDESSDRPIVKPKRYCACGYRCDCLELIVRNKVLGKHMQAQLEWRWNNGLHTRRPSIVSPIDPDNLYEVLDQFKHLKYCKAYHALFHERQFHRIKRKPGAHACRHHRPESGELPLESNHHHHHLLHPYHHQLTLTARNRKRIRSESTNDCLRFSDSESESSCSSDSDCEPAQSRRRSSKVASVSDAGCDSNRNSQQVHIEIDSCNKVHCVQFNGLSNGTPPKIASEPVHLTEIDVSILADQIDHTRANGTGESKQADLVKRTKNDTNRSRRADSYSRSTSSGSSRSQCSTHLAIIGRYLSAFMCFVQMLFIMVDFGSDVWIASRHFLSENYIATSITLCFIYWAAYMHLLFDGSFHRKLLQVKRRVHFVRFNSVCADLVIGLVYLLMPLKNLCESLYLVFITCRWRLRLAVTRDRKQRDELQVVIRSAERKAHKVLLIQSLFQAFPQFLYQLFFAIVAYNHEELPNPNAAHALTILTSLASYVLNSYHGDVYCIEDHLNKHFEELRHVSRVRFQRLPLRCRLVLFSYTLSDFLLNFPFWLAFYKLTLPRSLLLTLALPDFYLFIAYIVLFVKSYISFFKAHLSAMRLERDGAAGWSQDVLFIRRNSHARLNFLFVGRLLLCVCFLALLRGSLDRRPYLLALFIFAGLLALTIVGYLLKVALVAEQLLSARTVRTWRRIFQHLERLNGFSAFNQRLFVIWAERILVKNFYFQWRVLLFNVCHVLTARHQMDCPTDPIQFEQDGRSPISNP